MSLPLPLTTTPGLVRIVLGLDTGMSFGWAALRADELGAVTILGSGVHKVEKGHHEGHRWLDVHRFVTGLVRDFEPTAIAVEHVARHPMTTPKDGGKPKMPTKAAHNYGGMRAMVSAVAWHSMLPLLPVGVGKAKQRATGKGNANKAVMVAAAARHLGRQPQSHDEADAMFVALCGCDEAVAWRVVDG